jgi:hypothetical protein
LVFPRPGADYVAPGKNTMLTKIIIKILVTHLANPILCRCLSERQREREWEREIE